MWSWAIIQMICECQLCLCMESLTLYKYYNLSSQRHLRISWIPSSQSGS